MNILKREQVKKWTLIYLNMIEKKWKSENANDKIQVREKKWKSENICRNIIERKSEKVKICISNNKREKVKKWTFTYIYKKERKSEKVKTLELLISFVDTLVAS